MRSITRQVLTTVLLAQVVLVTCIISLLLLHERSTRLRALDARLQGRADSLAGAIQDAEDAAANVFVDPREFQPSVGDKYAVYGESGRLITGSIHDESGLLQRKGVTGFRNASESGVRYRIKEQPGVRIIDRAETHGAGVRRAITLVYATPETWVRHEIAEATRFYVLAGVLTTVIVALLVTWSLRNSLRPIVELTAAASKIQAPPGLHFEAPPSVARVQELSVLAASLERAVARVRKAFQKEQQFVGDAAHELKTAAAVIRSGVQVLLVRPRETAEYVSGLNRLLDDTDRMERVVKQMLQSADIAENPPGSASCDLVQAAEQAMANLRPMSELTGVPVRLAGSTRTNAALPLSRAVLLMENLVANAIQHSQRGREVVCRIDQHDAEIVLTIEDSGAGIHPDAVAHVFERFYREDASRSRNTGGTGLGLAICKSIVNASGGDISIASKPGVGTTVRVVFMRA